MRSAIRRTFGRRLEVLRLPVASLQRHGFVMSLDPAATMLEPDAVGVGSDGTALAVWPYRKGISRKRVTWHVGPGGGGESSVPSMETDLRWVSYNRCPRRVLLAAAPAKSGAVNAEVWTSSGELKHRGYFGDAIQELLPTSAGKVWADTLTKRWAQVARKGMGSSASERI